MPVAILQHMPSAFSETLTSGCRDAGASENNKVFASLNLVR
jgi:hypothetical protein